MAFREQAEGRAINQIRYDVNVPLKQGPKETPVMNFETMVGILPQNWGVAALRMCFQLLKSPALVDGVERSERLFFAGRGADCWIGPTLQCPYGRATRD